MRTQPLRELLVQRILDAPDPHRASSVERGASLVGCPFFHDVGLPFWNPVRGTERLTDRRALARGGVSDLLSRGAGLLVPSVAPEMPLCGSQPLAY